MGDGWRDWWKSWSPDGPYVHPDSPVGGAGIGASRSPGSWGSSTTSTLFTPPDPRSPASRYFDFRLPRIDLFERARAVYDALEASKTYIPAALREATGQELYAVVEGIIPGLLMAVGVLAVTTAVGAGAGAAVGAIFFGAGAAPGAAIGAEAGFDAGLVLLDYLGIAFLVTYIGSSLIKGAATAGEAAKEAWDSVDHPNVKGMMIDHAAQTFAKAVAQIFRGVLQGVVAFLLAKGTEFAAARVAELVGKLKASKIGAGFAEWVERNWRTLVDEPKLQPEKSTGGAGTPGENAAGGGSKSDDGGGTQSDDAQQQAAKEAAAKAAREARFKDLEKDPQTGKPNAKSKREAEAILQAEDQYPDIKNARRPDLSKGEPNIDFKTDKGWVDVKSPEPNPHRTLEQQAQDIADKSKLYDPDVTVLVDLNSIPAADRGAFIKNLSDSGADMSKMRFVPRQ